MKKLFHVLSLGWGFSLFYFAGNAQQTPDSLPQQVDLQKVVQYALKNYPLVQQALLDEKITDRQVKSRLADWYPQLNVNGNYQYNFQIAQAYFNNSYVPSGTNNVALLGLGATQTIFNRDVLLASRTARDVRLQSRQFTLNDKINVVVDVSKAFYDVILTQKQIEVLNDDIERLERSLKDAYNQYQGGLVDKTDYKRAMISLNNSKAEKKSDEELLTSKYAVLKQEMGYAGTHDLTLVYDSAQMESAIYTDTLATVDYNNRIEYQTLLTQKRLQMANWQYNKWSYYPSLSAYGAYNLNYLTNSFSQLFKQTFPTPYAGISLSFPLFEGTRRIQNIRIAELQVQRVELDIVNLKNMINSQYAQALSAYKGYLNDYFVLKENLQLARDVFNTIALQYRSGIKAYLDLITAQTDLRTAQTNYSNALFQVLTSKLDVQKALGTVQLGTSQH